jgi:hypothetical protein
LTLNSSGRVSMHVDVHNSGGTRKFYWVEAWIKSPAAGLTVTSSLGCYRIGGDSWDSWTQTVPNGQVSAKWSQIRTDPNLQASFRLEAYRLDC